MVTDRAAEFPSVAPVACGKPHQHAYTAGSRVVGEDKWGPQQVCFYLLPTCSANPECVPCVIAVSSLAHMGLEIVLNYNRFRVQLGFN